MLVSLVVASVGTAVFAVRRSTAARVGGPSVSASTASTDRVAIIADSSYFTDSGDPSNQWPATTASRIRVSLLTRAGKDQGYLASGSDSFTTLAASLAPDTDVVVFAGGIGRQSNSFALVKAATKAYAAASEAAPGVRILVVSRPAISGQAGTTDSALRSAATVADARWIDTSSWFTAAGSTKNGALTALGVREAADGFETLLAPLVNP